MGDPVTALKIPTVHLNGTSKAALVEQLDHAVGALNAALRALYDAQPNARDYYTQGPDAINEALADHRSRLERVQIVRNEIVAIWEGLEP